MERDGQLNHSEVRPEVASRTGDVLDEKRAHLFCEFAQLIRRERVQIPW